MGRGETSSIPSFFLQHYGAARRSLLGSMEGSLGHDGDNLFSSSTTRLRLDCGARSKLAGSSWGRVGNSSEFTLAVAFTGSNVFFSHVFEMIGNLIVAKKTTSANQVG